MMLSALRRSLSIRIAAIAFTLIAAPSQAQLLYETAHIIPDEGHTGDKFGSQVAIDGNLLAIAAPGVNIQGSGSGAVYIYKRTTGQQWALEATLVAPDPVAGDQFGFSIGLSGDRIVIGAPGRDLGATDAGAAFFFTRVDGLWSLESTVGLDNPEESSGFGYAVGIDGQNAAVTANNAQASTQWVYAYHRDAASSWEREFTHSNSLWSYGQALAVNGDRFMVGTPGGTTSPFGNGAVAVEVYRRSANAVWQADGFLASKDSSYQTVFGNQLAIDGDVAIAASVWPYTGGMIDMFDYSDGAWIRRTSIGRGYPSNYSTLGRTLALQNDRILAGDSLGKLNVPGRGPATLFTYLDGSFQVTADLQGSDTTTIDGFYIVAMSGSTAVVGAPSDIVQGVESGSVYTFQIDCTGDFDHTGFVDTDDFDAFVHAFEAGDDRADADGSGYVDTDDFDYFVHAFEAGC